MRLLGGSWDLVSKVISTVIGVISIVTLIITQVTKSHALSRDLPTVAEVAEAHAPQRVPNSERGESELKGEKPSLDGVRLFRDLRHRLAGTHGLSRREKFLQHVAPKIAKNLRQQLKLQTRHARNF